MIELFAPPIAIDVLKPIFVDSKAAEGTLVRGCSNCVTSHVVSGTFALNVRSVHTSIACPLMPESRTALPEAHATSLLSEDA